VFSALDVQRSDTFEPSEYSEWAFRSDARLGAVEGQSEASTVAYPGEEPSSLDRLRFIYLQPRSDRVPYFRPDDSWGRNRRRR
jgi:hypothetical protein